MTEYLSYNLNLNVHAQYVTLVGSKRSCLTPWRLRKALVLNHSCICIDYYSAGSTWLPEPFKKGTVIKLTPNIIHCISNTISFGTPRVPLWKDRCTRMPAEMWTHCIHTWNFLGSPVVCKGKRGRGRGSPLSSRANRRGGEDRHCHTLVRMNIVWLDNSRRGWRL
jgi:hypothetical protein